MRAHPAFPSPSYSPGSPAGAFVSSGLPPLVDTNNAEVERLKKENAALTERIAKFEKEQSRKETAVREKNAELEEYSKDNEQLRSEMLLREQAQQQLLSQQEQLRALIDRQLETVKADLRRVPMLDGSLAAILQKLQAALFYNDLLKTSPQQLEYLLQKSKHQIVQYPQRMSSSWPLIPPHSRNDANEEEDSDDNEIPVDEPPSSELHAEAIESDEY